MLMTAVILFILSMFYQGIFMFCLNRNHLLIMLLCLEFLILSLFMMLMIYIETFWLNLYFSMVFLTFSVCESAFGLSILVSLVRTHGNDYFNTLSIL
uniref:NADH-ubiquinone oxidoreductase chain 4L n=1 Tax=Chinolyda flagellicornis TaxID=2492400 RepID=A0A3G8FWC3_9HYME|nr:NADH dehydrogenase subunit 4L [Chinolyda flagellicornis]